MVKIFALESHSNYIGNTTTSGVDFARIVQPMNYLNKQKGFKVHIWNNSQDPNVGWDDVTKAYDVIYTSYTPNDWAYAAMGMFARKNGCKIIYDVDDNLWDILSDNVAYETYHPGSKPLYFLNCILKDVDYITTTNPFLKNVMAHRIPVEFNKIKVFPNYIDLKLYKYKPKFKDTNDLHLTHFGSTSHFTSLQEDKFFNAISRLMVDFPNLTFETVGAFIPKLKMKFGQRYISGTGSPNLFTWVESKFPEVLDRTDVFVAPLTDNVYNKSKSGIKYLEVSSAKKPGVYQNIRQYKELITHKVNGMLAYHEQDWYHSIKELLENKELRKSMGEKAYENIQEHTIQQNIERYTDFFRDI
jgi:glycosyltransferase involved in cell wall biosynthesis